MGECRSLTDYGSFIVSGTGASSSVQLHRSPGVFFSTTRARRTRSGQAAVLARIIPYRGSWLDFEFDPGTSCTSASTVAQDAGDDLLKAIGLNQRKHPRALLRQRHLPPDGLRRADGVRAEA